MNEKLQTEADATVPNYLQCCYDTFSNFEGCGNIINSIEQGLLVFLEILVVSGRQAFVGHKESSHLRPVSCMI